MTADSQTIRLSDGRTLGYAKYGAVGGRPVLYLHGGMSSRLDIAFAHEYCLSQNIELIAPDRPGTGLSSPQPGRRLLDLAKDMKELSANLNYETMPLFAWSLAGPYALACAFAYPSTFPRIATIGGVAPLNSQEAINELGLLIDRLVLTWPVSWKWLLSLLLASTGKLPPAILKFQMEREVNSEPDRAIIKALSISQGTRFVYESVKQGGDGIIDDYDAVAAPWGFALQDLKCHLDIFHGELDTICPFKHALHLQESVKGSRLHVVRGEGHFLLHRRLPDVLSVLLASS
jgi:pimeloyl-ACP methyl ester carboxylesterase